MRGQAAFVVAALVLVAGCNVGDPGTSSPTVSPAPVPETATSGPVVTPTASYPPGLTAAGIGNASALVRAHDAALADRSYRAVVVTNRSTATGWERERRVARVANRTNYHVRTVRSTGENRSVQLVYADGGTRYARCEPGGEPTACRSAPAEPAERNPTGRILGLLSGANSRVDGRVRQDGRVYHRVVATGNPYGIGSPYGVVEVANYTATALVAPSGVVSELRATYELVDGDERLGVRVHLRYTDVGATRVTPPSWYGNDTAD